MPVIMIHIFIDVNLFNSIYPGLNENLSNKYYDFKNFLKFNKLRMNSNNELLLLNFNKRPIDDNFGTVNYFTNYYIKKFAS